MNETINTNIPEPKKIGVVWTEKTRIEPKELIIPKKSPESIDDIPTLPDLDDLQDILENDVSTPPIVNLNSEQDAETVNTLAQVSGISGSVDGIEEALEVLKSYIPEVETDSADSVWTVDTLLNQLLEKNDDLST